MGHLLDDQRAADALAYYYAFVHDAERTELLIEPDNPEPAQGFLVQARTGQDLFRPLVTLRAETRDIAEALLQRGLVAGRPYYLTVPEALSGWVLPSVQASELELLWLYQLDIARYTPQMNVMVQIGKSAEGWPRCVVESQGVTYSTAGVNWMTARFAELYVYTEPVARGKGWGKAVVNVLCGLLLRAGKTPLYAVDQHNEYSIRLAEHVGFVDTGARELACSVVRYGG